MSLEHHYYSFTHYKRDYLSLLYNLGGSAPLPLLSALIAWPNDTLCQYTHGDCALKILLKCNNELA